ncbi:MAG: hypothetical protein COA79_14470 [Planctomycetota bacterium]|nr:MAG: hypothetical protein COA79_14470 [Planctomycetota bacterium]
MRKESIKTDMKNKVSVLMDVSSSMQVNGFEETNRMDQVLEYWHGKLVEKDFIFEKYVFNSKIRSVQKFAVFKSKNRVSQTHLYKNLGKMIDKCDKNNSQALICFTDGVDSSEDSKDELLEIVEGSEIPVYFIPTELNVPSKPYIAVERLEVDSTSLVGSRVPVNMLAQFSNTISRPITLKIKKENKIVFEKEVKVFHNGSQKKRIAFDLPIPTAGIHLFTGEIYYGDEKMVSLNWSVHGLEKETRKFLLYQGALDWGTRHLRGVLDHKNNFDLDVLFHPDFKSSGLSTNGRKNNFPTQDKLNEYNVIVLLNLNKRQITEDMSAKIRKFVKEGGSVLFIISNPQASKEFSNSSLEKLLPVTFLNQPEGQSRQDIATNSFLKDVSRVSTFREDSFTRSKERGQKLPPLFSFELTREGALNSIFDFAKKDNIYQKELLPKFRDLSPVKSAKAGAVILVDHQKPGEGVRQIVLAVQNFGRGKSAVLTSDTLWPWKLRTLSSDSNLYQLFWKNLLNWLSAGQKSQPHWVLNSVVCKSGQKAKLKFNIPKRSKMVYSDFKFEVRQGEHVSELHLNKSENANIYLGDLQIDGNKEYEISAKVDDEVISQTVVSGILKLKDIELRVLKPDINFMEEIAELSGGKVIRMNEKFDWEYWLPTLSPVEVTTTEDRLWHKPWIFILLVSLILAEFLVRRKYKLI